MKTIELLMVVVLFSFTTVITGQKKSKPIEEATFNVSGVCDICKKRIENAALIKGVKFAEWDKEKQLLHVVYNAEKTNLDTIHNAVAESGYDTEKVTAPQKAYDKLPECCAYRDGVEVH